MKGHRHAGGMSSSEDGVRELNSIVISSTHHNGAISGPRAKAAMSAAVEGATTMSRNHNLRPISTTQPRATKGPSHYEVVEALKEIGRGTTFLPQQIEVDAPIHLCFKSYQIEMVRQIVRWALDNPDIWLKLHPKQHTLVKKVGLSRFAWVYTPTSLNHYFATAPMRSVLPSENLTGPSEVMPPT